MNSDLENSFVLFICHGPRGAAPADLLPLSGPASILLPCTLMDILSLFTRCCYWRQVRVSYYRTDYSCCPGWKTSTSENCNV